MENGGLGGKLRVLAVVLGKTHGLGLTAGHMGDPVLREIRQYLFPKPAQLRSTVVKAAADYLRVDGI